MYNLYAVCSVHEQVLANQTREKRHWLNKALKSMGHLMHIKQWAEGLSYSLLLSNAEACIVDKLSGALPTLYDNQMSERLMLGAICQD